MLILLLFHTISWSARMQPANAILPIISISDYNSWRNALPWAKTQPQEDNVPTGYVATGLWVCSPQLPCAFGRLINMLEPQESWLGAAEDSRNTKLLPAKVRFGPRAAELSSRDHRSDPSTLPVPPTELDAGLLPISSTGTGCRQKCARKHKL